MTSTAPSAVRRALEAQPHQIHAGECRRRVGLVGATASLPMTTPCSLAPISAPHIQNGRESSTAWVVGAWSTVIHVQAEAGAAGWVRRGCQSSSWASAGVPVAVLGEEDPPRPDGDEGVAHRRPPPSGSQGRARPRRLVAAPGAPPGRGRARRCVGRPSRAARAHPARAGGVTAWAAVAVGGSGQGRRRWAAALGARRCWPPAAVRRPRRPPPARPPPPRPSGGPAPPSWTALAGDVKSAQKSTFKAVYTSTSRGESSTITLAQSPPKQLFSATDSSGSTTSLINTGTTTYSCAGAAAPT